jgi:CheY-like chemotaxis protein
MQEAGFPPGTTNPNEAPGRAPVMIVENDPEEREVLGEILLGAGYALAYAFDGEDALKRLERGLRPCVILLDLLMPRIDGLQFRQRQLTAPELAEIPVIVLSGLGETEQIAREMGVPSLRKPVARADLVRLVKEHCGEAESR